jgi:hypothetical protein
MKAYKAGPFKENTAVASDAVEKVALFDQYEQRMAWRTE